MHIVIDEADAEAVAAGKMDIDEAFDRAMRLHGRTPQPSKWVAVKPAEWYREMEQFFDKALATAIEKNADYATPEEPYKNFDTQEIMGITTRERSLLCRICEKLQRVVNLLDKPHSVQDEPISRTLIDMAVQLALLDQMLSHRRKNG